LHYNERLIGGYLLSIQAVMTSCFILFSFQCRLQQEIEFMDFCVQKTIAGFNVPHAVQQERPAQQLNALSINPQYYTGDSKVNYSALFNINSYIIGSQDWYENNQ
jgi:hypothetical protein